MALDKAALGALQPLFGFHRWHAQSPTSARPYREGMAALVNSLEPRCVVDVGCGLGSVLARVEAPQRYGYDVDRGAIRAARWLRSRSIQFCEGGFEAVRQTDIDVLIAVNWPHDFPPEQIERWIVALLPRTRFLLLDRVDPTSPLDYPYYHDFAFLAGRAKPVSVDKFGEDYRDFILYKVSR